MKLKCAWCEREGRPANVGDVEPLDNRAETHGLCEEHRRTWLDALGITEAPAPPSPPPS
jgi:hypothetical protein